MLVKACSLTLLTAGFGGMGDLVVVTTPLWPALRVADTEFRESKTIDLEPVPTE